MKYIHTIVIEVREIFESTMLYEDSYLLSSIVQLLLRVLEHLLTPQIKEVIRIGIKFQAILAVLSARSKKMGN